LLQPVIFNITGFFISLFDFYDFQGLYSELFYSWF